MQWLMARPLAATFYMDRRLTTHGYPKNGFESKYLRIFLPEYNQKMLRKDERSAWEGFLATVPRFADEDIANWSAGPDPPDVLCTGATGKVIGVELTKWVEHDQVEDGRGRELLENSYLKIIRSENEARPDHIGRVFLYDKSLRIRQKDASHFRTQLFDFLVGEDAKPEPSWSPEFSIPVGYWNTVKSWSTPQGAPVNDFTSYPLLGKYLDRIWIFPRQSREKIPAHMPWILFETPGGVYTPQWMVQAAIDRIHAKIRMYQSNDICVRHSLGEFDLLCYYCDEALLHNTPIHAIEFGFQQLVANVKQALSTEPNVFDRIFLFHPYEDVKVMRVY
jgi:hypothetical protein